MPTHLLSAVVIRNATSEQIEIVTLHSRIPYLPDFEKRTFRSTVKNRATFLDFKWLFRVRLLWQVLFDLNCFHSEIKFVAKIKVKVRNSVMMNKFLLSGCLFMQNFCWNVFALFTRNCSVSSDYFYSVNLNFLCVLNCAYLKLKFAAEKIYFKY